MMILILITHTSHDIRPLTCADELLIVKFEILRFVLWNFKTDRVQTFKKKTPTAVLHTHKTKSSGNHWYTVLNF